MTYPTNTFKSATYRGISSNSFAPQAISINIPEGGYALILGLTVSNKSTTERFMSLALKKFGQIESTFILYNVGLLPGTAFQVIDGDKLVIERGDILEAWGDSGENNALDLVVSYVVYSPVV